MISNIEQRNVRLRFFALYAVSMALAFVVVIVLWKRISDVFQQGATEQQTIENAQLKSQVQQLTGELAQKEQAIIQLQQTTTQQTQSSVDTTNNSSAVLSQKDVLISNLQAQVKQLQANLQNSSLSTGSDGSEWKQKYSSLKASFDKLAQSEQALKSAYKTVADDNKRLLTQLQSVKKG